MKIEMRLEDGKPIIFLLSEIEKNQVTCWTDKEQHSSATRGYMRSLPKPQTGQDLLACWQTLCRYADHVAYTMRQ